jgi:hypothetical protein
VSPGSITEPDPSADHADTRVYVRDGKVVKLVGYFDRARARARADPA